MNSIISHVLFIQGYTLCYFMLDLLLVNNTAATSGVNFVRNITVHPLCFSDHSLVFCQLGDNRDQPTTVTRSYRRIKNVDQAAFSHDVTRSRLYDPEVIVIYFVDEYANLFDFEVSRIIVLHAPLLTSTKVLTTTTTCPKKPMMPNEDFVELNAGFERLNLIVTRPLSKQFER